jgi:hypothetical protein
MTVKKKTAKTREPLKTAPDYGTPCTHCGERYGHTVTHTYPNGNRRRICGNCKKPFISVRLVEIDE